MNSTLKSLLFWMVLVVIGVLVWNFSTRFQRSDQAISFSTFMTQVQSGQVSSVTITGNEINGVLKTNDSFRTHAPTQYEGLANKLIEGGVVVVAKDPTTSPWATLLYSWAPILLLIGFWISSCARCRAAATRRSPSARARRSCRAARKRR